MPSSVSPGRERIDSYLICATPRTGSSLLCGLLDSTGVAGYPESWFRQQDERGVGGFAARIMWGTMEEVVANLASVYPEHAGSRPGLLSAAFGRMRFVYLRRGDVAVRAVSLLRAEQWGVWFETVQERQEPEGEPSFDFGQVRERVRLIEDHNAAWEEWFASVGIQPYLVRYEELDAEPVRAARGVLGFLGLDLPAGREVAVRHKAPRR